MKRLIRWIINWLYAEEIAALVQEAVDDEFEATWPEAFRHQPEHNSVIPQEIWAAVILRLPNHAEIIHGQWMDNTNHTHILTRTVKLANTTYIREFQLTMDALPLANASCCRARSGLSPPSCSDERIGLHQLA